MHLIIWINIIMFQLNDSKPDDVIVSIYFIIFFPEYAANMQFILKQKSLVFHLKSNLFFIKMDNK